MQSQRRTSSIAALIAALVVLSTTGYSQTSWDPFLDTVQQRTIQWFLDVTPVETGMTPDRWPAEWSPASIAAVGFALTTYPVAAERSIITRTEAADRTLKTLRYLWNLPQSTDRTKTAGHKGLFYHFLKKNGMREWNCELSTIDTGLLMAGVLFSQSYYDKAVPAEQEIRALADSLYRRVDWKWATDGRKGLAMGWSPEEGFHKWSWFGYTEAMILYFLALGSPTHPVGPEGWEFFTERYHWATHYGQEHLNFMPLFGHQYSHVWVDFRGITDKYMKTKKIDYFENSRRATYVHRTYAIENPNRWIDYSDSIWGMTACDGPKDTVFTVNGIKRDFRSYSARGTGADEHLDDGTIAPTAAGGSVAFAPEIAVPALKAIRNKYGSKVWTKYGFIDAFNPTYITPATPHGWFDHDYLGIDQGPIALMIENHRNGFIWEVMKKNPYIVQGIRRAGFTGGWLDASKEKK
jgi:hypothetical protein